MAARIDLQALQRQLDSFQAKFQQWAQRTVAGAEGLRDGHLARLREFQGEPGCRGWQAEGQWRPGTGVGSQGRRWSAGAARHAPAACPLTSRRRSPAPCRSRHPHAGAAAGGAGAASSRRAAE